MTYEDVKRIRANPTMTDVDNEELARMIDEAIEFRIPKKPIPSENVWDCPNCGFCVRIDNYCRVCGQKIDWGEE